jgi:hypothetical protein
VLRQFLLGLTQQVQEIWMRTSGCAYLRPAALVVLLLLLLLVLLAGMLLMWV